MAQSLTTNNIKSRIKDHYYSSKLSSHCIHFETDQEELEERFKFDLRQYALIISNIPSYKIPAMIDIALKNGSSRLSVFHLFFDLIKLMEIKNDIDT